MKLVFALLLSLLAWCTSALASDGTPIDPAIRFGHYHADYVVNADGTVKETHEWSKTILKETALENSKSASVSYSTSAQQAEVLAAYTLKADGRRLDVPKDNYQLAVNSGKGKASPVYSDWTTLTVVFPDVAVGDSVVLSYQLTQTDAMFPGHFSTGQLFHKNVAHDDIRIRFDYPATLWVQYEGRGMKETLGAREGRKLVEWSYANPRPVKSERRDYSVVDLDKEVGYAFSTFRNHAEIAAAYGVRALPKATVSERVNKLAAGIVGDKVGKKEQARALYEWVATNITYAGNCIGIGAVVPRDIDFILDNKMGDCKDHAMLLQALLAAQGIKSTQALVNSGSSYRLLHIPVVHNVNHVINYLPEFDLFVDSTSNATPFGMLPHGDQDKPVLLVEGHREGLKTPAAPSSRNQQTVRSVLKIATDGSASGSVDVALAGEWALNSREWARNTNKEYEEELVKNIFRNQGMIGSGKFEKDDPRALSDAYSYKASFNAEKFMKVTGGGAFYISPSLGMGTPISQIAQSAMEVESEADVTCYGITMVEDYVIELPKTIKVLSIPANLKIINELASFKATYKLKGNTLLVSRVLEDRMKGNVCSPQVMLQYKKIMGPVLDNLKEQVLYK
jgi:transglutaminase-like putative cysteine protease